MEKYEQILMYTLMTVLVIAIMAVVFAGLIFLYHFVKNCSNPKR
jgi:preprotein translocase subunit SecE